MGNDHDVVVLAASAGGVEALSSLVSYLPRDLHSALFVVLHVGSSSVLPAILSKAGPLPATHGQDGQPMRAGTIVVAPPNKHLLLGPGIVRVVIGPKEHYVRPSADLLFRSAAEHYGERVIGVVLSGSLRDGTAGLEAIAQARGVTMVQDPREALVPDMPKSALEHVRVDHVLPIGKLAEMIVRLAPPTARISPPGTVSVR